MRGGSTTNFLGILCVPSSSRSLVVGWPVHCYVHFVILTRVQDHHIVTIVILVTFMTEVTVVTVVTVATEVKEETEVTVLLLMTVVKVVIITVIKYLKKMIRKKKIFKENKLGQKFMKKLVKPVSLRKNLKSQI